MTLRHSITSVLGCMIFTVWAVAGVNVWTSHGPTVGNVEALVIDPVTPAVLYAGTLGGGVFKSTDGGGSWASVNTGLTDKYVQTLVIDPVSPATLYAGTNGGGVFKSTNGAGNWASCNTGLTTSSISALAVDPSDPSKLYAGTYLKGMYKSTDGGGTWIKLGDFDYWYIYSFSIDSGPPSVVYLGMYEEVSHVGGIFKSTDDGGTWHLANHGLPYYSGLNAPAIDPAVPSTLYAGTSGWGVYKSTDSGASWNWSSTGVSGYLGAVCPAVDPVTPGILYVGTNKGGVYMSTDGAGNWAPFNNGLPEGAACHPLAINPSNPNQIFAAVSQDVWEITSVCTTAPNLTVQPQSQTVTSGQTAILSVAADSPTPLSYQWYLGISPDTANPIPGATGASYTTPALEATASYWVRVSNDCGPSDSGTATVTVYSVMGKYTIGGYLGVGLTNPERAIHLRGENAVFRLDRSANTAAFMLVRTDAGWQPLKAFVIGVNTPWGPGSEEGFVINDLGPAVSGPGDRRLTILDDGTAIITGEVRAAGFFTPSARARKTDIQPLEDALGAVLTLHGVRFRWRDTGAPAIGFIAEAVGAAVPEVVSGLGVGIPIGSAPSGRPTVFGLDYGRLATLLVEGVKQQQREIKVLQQQRDRLNALLEELRSLRKNMPNDHPQP